MKRFLILTLLGVAISNVMGDCTFNFSKKNGHISCRNITSEDYVTSSFEFKANVFNYMPIGSVDKISVHILDSHIPIIDDWLSLPWDDNFSLFHSIKIVNSSVSTFKISLKLLAMIDTINLSGNNISDYRFLSKMRKLRHLHLSHNKFSQDCYLYTYLQSKQTRLKSINLSYCNFDQLSLKANLIENYDFSFNPNLTVIQFNYSLGDRPPFLNLSGNTQNIDLKNVQSVAPFCLSLDLSNSNFSFNSPLLKTLRISDKIILNNNNIPNLNESTFKLSDLISNRCLIRISVDISNCRLSHISSNFFSSYTLNSLNLSNNNLVTLKGSIFRQSDILNLDLSNSNVTKIAPSVFNYLSVKTLDLSMNNMSTIDGVFDFIESVKHLDISSNPIETLNEKTFKNCRDLEILNLTNVFIKYLNENPFLNIFSLRNLILSFNSPINATTITNIHVTELILRNTTVTRLNAEQFKGFYKLKKLSFFESHIPEIDNLAFKGLFNLKKLNNLKEVGHYNLSVYQQLYSLEYLDWSRHNIDKINLELKDLHSLKKINLSLNSLSLIGVDSFATLKQLEVLSLSENKLSTIVVGTFRSLSKLTHLYLSKNHLQQLAPGIFSGLDHLVLLDLSHNDLLRTKPHLIFGVSLPKLMYLHLQVNGFGNEYAKADDELRQNEFSIIGSHNNVKYIDISQNGWRCPTLLYVLTLFKNRNVSYSPTSPDYITNNINGISCS